MTPAPSAPGLAPTGLAASRPPGDAIISTHRLTRRFGSMTAVDDFTLSIDRGEVFGLLGPNGAGKTTVIKMLITLLPPSSGNATVAGFDIVAHPAKVRQVIGYVPQMLSADGELTGYENLLTFARLYGIPHAQRRARIQRALSFMDLEEVANKLVRTYSGGMIRRLEIAESLLHRPAVVFLDEPTVGLDPIARDGVWAHIKELQRDFGMTILLTTHYMDEADSLCDRVAIMYHGRIVAIGTPGELKRSTGQADATLDDVFEHYAGGTEEIEGGYREAARERRTARRLG